ncbi:MAG TPA: hypothetical protein GX716_05035, partial [Firmicutes bacterium]|nr:hypothetical protein [Candidatus Fermentithermobacillaceae bacterium]
RNQNGVEIRFAAKPDESVLNTLRDSGFKWNGKRKVWYKKGLNEENLALAQRVLEGKAEAPAPEPATAETPTTRGEDTVEELPREETLAAGVSNWVSERLRQGKGFSAKELRNRVAEAYGGTISEGKFRVKDAYDLMELGINKRLLDMEIPSGEGVTVEQAVRNIERIENEVLSKIPTQTVRTTETDEFQQFSTPPNIAYTAAWAANIGPTDTVLEPSAGIGGLAVWAKINDAREVIVNELSERRAALLAEMEFDRLFKENAEQLHNILPRDVRPTAVIMNPPFSATAGRMGSARDTRFAQSHLEQALKRLEPNGRLVAIVGRGMADNAAMFRDWWKKIKGEYNVRANVGIDGKNYKKYGTTFDVQLVVIDKNGPTPEGGTLTGQFEELPEAIKALEVIRNDRARPVEHAAGEPTGEAAPTESRGEARAEPAVSPSTRGVGHGIREDHPSPPGVSGPGDRVLEPLGTPDDQEAGMDVEPPPQRRPRRGGEVAGPERVSEAELAGGRESVRLGQPSERVGQPSEATQAEVEAVSEITVESRGETQFGEEVLTGDESSPVYSRYVPQKLKVEGAKEHPSALAESAAMAAVVPIDPTYTPDLPKSLIEKGELSIAQLEPIVYAGQSHEQMLPDGKRRGYFIGDGTGVGKGREVAGIILDNMRRGRKKAIWASKNVKLLEDAIRDWTDLGGKKTDILPLSKVKLGTDIKLDRGILFVPYDTLKSGLSASKGEIKKTAGKRARIDQVVEWFGKDYDGVIIFDEAHLMQNCLPVKGVRGVKQASARALAGVELQRLLPNARVVYSSATGATDPVNLAYADRLGLWGEGTPFPTAENFVTEISAGGLAAMELVARDMKAMGSYISRTLSYEGCTYDTLEHQLTPQQTEIYDTLARSWQIVLQNVNEALEDTGQNADGQAKSNAMAQFWSSQQRFFNQILTAMQMPSVIKAVEKDLADGKSVVMQLVNTNQAIQERQLAELEEEQDLEDLDLTPRDILLQYLDRSFPTQQYEQYTDERGNVRSRPVTDSQGNPVINQEALEAKENLMREVGMIKVPDGPLELILDHFGVENVAEVTGRTRRVVRKPDESGRMRRVQESWSDRHCLADIESFRADKKRILVFSEAGGTGQSYHADPKTKNTRQRVHYVIQPGWRADVCVQGFGRTHRSNEASQPHYRLVTTSLKGQKRFISTIARRLDQLGALTKGQRQTGSQGLFSAADNLEGRCAKDALIMFYQDLVAEKIEGLDSTEMLSKMGLEKLVDEHGNLTSNLQLLNDVPRFLNRILSLESSVQNQVFDEFDLRLKHKIDQAIAAGNLDVGLEDFKADRIEVAEERTVFTDQRTKAETKYMGLDVYHKVKKNDFDTVLGLSKKVKGFKGFYRNTRSGNVYAFFPAQDKTLYTGEVVKQYRQVGQREGEASRITDDEFARGNWKSLSEEEARVAWDEALTKVPEFRKARLHLITGTVLPIWDRLPGGHQKVYRVKTDDGKQFLGRKLDEHELDITLQRLGASRTKQSLTSAEMLDKVISDNATIHLSNGWRIVRRKVQGESRIEILTHDPYYHRHELEKAGVFSERINWNTRFFIPTGENGPKVLDAITKYRPVVSIDMPEAMSTERREAIRRAEGGGDAYADLQSIEAELEEALDAQIGRSSDLRIVPEAVARTIVPLKRSDVDGYWIKDEEVRKRWIEADGVKTLTGKEKLLAAWQDLRNKMTREFE